MRKVIQQRRIKRFLSIAVTNDLKDTKINYSTVAYRLDDIDSAFGVKKLYSVNMVTSEVHAVNWADGRRVSIHIIKPDWLNKGRGAHLAAYEWVVKQGLDLVVEFSRNEDNPLCCMASKLGMPILHARPLVTITREKLESILIPSMVDRRRKYGHR